MTDEHDLEGVLKRYDAGPGERTKKTVMNRFRRTLGEHAGGGGGFWRRPVPLYRAAVAMVLLVALSFVAGRELSGGRRGSAAGPAEGPAWPAAVADELDWVPAASDFL